MADRDFIVPDDFIARLLMQMSLPPATQAGMSQEPPTKPAFLDWISVIASLMGMALPGRGGIGMPGGLYDPNAPYRSALAIPRAVMHEQIVQPTRSFDALPVLPYRLSGATELPHTTGVDSSFRRFIQELNEGTLKSSAQSDRLGDTTTKALSAVSYEGEREGLWKMLLNYLGGSSRQ